MSNGKPKILVVGGGPAGISAAVDLSESGQVDVDMMLLQDRLGGKASSWRDDDGYLIETGYHIFVGFYDRLTALMDRASIPLNSVVHSGGGVNNCYEAWSEQVHTLTTDLSRIAFAGQMIAYDGLPFWHRQNLNKTMAFAYLEAFTREDLTVHDDVCFSTWAIERGLRPEVTEYSLFRFFRWVWGRS